MFHCTVKRKIFCKEKIIIRLLYRKIRTGDLTVLVDGNRRYLLYL